MAEVNQNVGTTATAPIHRGTDFRLSIPVTNQSDEAVDLNGVQSIIYTIHASTPQKNPESPALVTKTVGSGVTVNDPSGGVFQVDVADSDTENLWPGAYYHQVMLVNSLGERFKPLSGTLQLTDRF